MSKQKKQGFTLIELMVVIVIIGILAAIAIPKLFGMTAKAKAQEVGPAAGTWSKLQQAFIAEKGKVGSNAKIGYTLPGAESTTASTSVTGNFSYTVSMIGTSAAADAIDATDETSGIATWTATSVGSMGECTKSAAQSWVATVDGTTGQVAATPPADANCVALTPNFSNLK